MKNSGPARDVSEARGDTKMRVSSRLEGRRRIVAAVGPGGGRRGGAVVYPQATAPRDPHLLRRGLPGLARSGRERAPLLLQGGPRRFRACAPARSAVRDGDDRPCPQLRKGAGHRVERTARTARSAAASRITSGCTIDLDARHVRVTTTQEVGVGIARARSMRSIRSDIRAATDPARKLEIKPARRTRRCRSSERVLAREPNSADAYNQIGYYYARAASMRRASRTSKKYQFMAPRPGQSV